MTSHDSGHLPSDLITQQMLPLTKTYTPSKQCNYRVINHLKRSCSDMAEEELNKMAVHLLNCQLETENRPTFECEESMSIGWSVVIYARIMFVNIS